MIIKAKRATTLLRKTDWDQRVHNCENVSEFGFSLLLRFVRIEAALKLLRYEYEGRSGWPDRLNFLNANWLPLRDLKRNNAEKYERLIGSGGNSLLKFRNQIAHEAPTITSEEYTQISAVADWGMKFLMSKASSVRD